MAYYDNVSALNPKLWFKFNGDATNYGSLTHTLSEIGSGSALTFPAGVAGNACVKFNNGKYYSFGYLNSNDLFDDRTFSIEVWAKGPATTPAANAIFDWVNGNQYLFIKHDLGTPGNERYTFTFKGGTSYPEYNMTSAYVARQTFHHIVVTFTPSAVKLYIDGALDQTLTNPNIPNSFTLDTSSSNQRQLGVQSQMAIDEFAAYPQELTANQVFNNYDSAYNAGAVSAPLTASALLPMPVISVISNQSLAASPATASATFPEPIQSALDNFTLLDTYMSTLTLEFWHKFNSVNFVKNFGTGLQSAFANPGQPLNNVVGGIQGTGSYAFETDDKLAAISTTGSGAGTSYYATALNDQDFTIGFWTKKLTPELIKFVNGYVVANQSTGDRVTFSYNANGGITFLIRANNSEHSVASSTDITNGEYHFVAGRLNNGTMELFIDGVSIGTASVQHSYTLNRLDFQGTGTTDAISVSQFFLSTSASVTSTEITNIYNAGIPTSLQANVHFPEPRITFASAFNNYIESKSPVGAFTMDEATGLPINHGSAVIAMQSLVDPVGYSQNEISLNNTGFNFTKPNQGLAGFYGFSAGTLSTNNIATFGVLFKLDNKAETHDLGGFGGVNTVASSGNGIQLQILISTGYIRVLSGNGNSTTTNFDGNVDYADNNWHLAIAVQEASSLKVYVDGKLHINQTRSTTFTDNGAIGIGRRPVFANTSTTSINKRIDEVFALPTALSAQEAFEAYQALRLEMGTTATALMVGPTTSLGFGPTINPGVAYSTALLVDPTQQDEINILPTPITANALLQMPNFAVTQNVNYSAAPMTASAQGENPVVIAGANKGALHMLATALFPQAYALIPGRWNASPMIAIPAEMIQPAVSSTRGGLVRPSVLTANAMLPTPPAYFQLTDDPYYVRLYNQHSTVTEERTFVGAGDLPGDNPIEPKKSFLKFFNDVLLSIPVGTNRYLINNMPDYAFDALGTTYYDANGDIYLAPTTQLEIQASGKTTASPTPLLSVGYYDPYQRPAVRINNIEFAYPENRYISKAPYTLEFTIKTTKANQIIAQGRWHSYYYSQRNSGSIGLYNGKLYGMSTAQNIGVSEIITHPINSDSLKKAGLESGYMLSDIRIDDGQWHHVIVQFGFEGDSRAQFWIDGELDKQIIDGYNAPGYNGRMAIRPFIIGCSSTETDFQSDFETSVWSYDPAGFVSFGDAKLNYTAYTKSIPIVVQPMIANANFTQDNKGSGNRARALMLYFWPEGAAVGTGTQGSNIFNQGRDGELDIPTLAGFSTDDFYRTPPQQWLEWDIFPIDVTGKYLSDVIKPEAFGGEENAILQANTPLLSGEPYNPLKAQRKINTRSSFKDENDDFRYIDLVNDIDLSQFDVIMFKNYPDDSIEQDTYSKNAEVDRYLSLTTSTLFEGFIKSLREAVDTGISLLVTNPKLAIDLGIVDRLEPLPDQKQSEDDPFVQDYELSILTPEAPSLSNQGYYTDSHYMSKIRLVNSIDGMTDYPVGIRTDKSFWKNEGTRNIIGTNKTWERVEYRPNGIQISDEFEVMVQPGSRGETPVLWSAPFENVKAGTIVTAWQLQIRQGQTLVDNKFKNYASSIIVEPGDILNGTQCGGKIFVDLMHARLIDSPDYASIDLNRDYWIDIAENIEAISSAAATLLRNSNRNLDNIYASPSNPAYIKSAYWTHNDSSYLEIGGEQITLTKALSLNEIALSGKRARNSRKSNNSVIDSALGMYTGGGQLWFNIQYSYNMDTFALWTPTISSLGILWLSQRSSIPGQVTNHTAKTASATFVNPSVVVDRIVSINAQSMVALGIITNAVGLNPAEVRVATLPMTAHAMLSAAAKVFFATPMVAVARLATNFNTVTSSIDEVVVYLNHVDPILYLREDIIK